MRDKYSEEWSIELHVFTLCKRTENLCIYINYISLAKIALLRVRVPPGVFSFFRGSFNYFFALKQS